jgi:hypothetical protein
MESKPELSVVIPCREVEGPEVRLDSLAESTYRDLQAVIVHDQGKGANWTRDQGFKMVNTEFVLFSDN